jgi:hypothetical protein
MVIFLGISMPESTQKIFLTTKCIKIQVLDEEAEYG